MTGFDTRLTPARPDLAAAHLKGKVASDKFADPVMLQVMAPTAPLLARPDGEIGLSSELLHGEKFAAYEIIDGWVWGQSDLDDYVGYAPEAAFAETDEDPTHIVTALQSHFYPGPSIKTRPIAWAPCGARLAGDVIGDFLNTVIGWVPMRHVAPADASADDFVAIAERFLNTPYLWGGRTAVGVDCSGLVQIALHAAGWSCPRDSDMQELGIADVLDTHGSLRRGDIVFWKGHVGMMRDARTLLHANAHHMAVVSEPLEDAKERIAKAGGGDVTSVRRLSD